MAIVAANPTQGANLFSGAQSFYTHDDRADAKDGTNVYLHTALEFSATEAESLCDAIRYQASVLKGEATGASVHPVFSALDIDGSATIDGTAWSRGFFDGTAGCFHGALQLDGTVTMPALSALVINSSIVSDGTSGVDWSGTATSFTIRNGIIVGIS